MRKHKSRREFAVVQRLLPLLQGYKWLLPVIVVLGLLASVMEGASLALLIPLLDLLAVHAGTVARNSSVFVHLQNLADSVPASMRILAVVLAIFAAICLKNLISYANVAAFSYIDSRAGHDLRVDGVGCARPAARGVPLDHYHPSFFECLHGGRAGERCQQVELQRIGDRQQLQGVSLERRQAAEAIRDYLRQPLRWWQRTPCAPHGSVAGQGARLQAGEDQLTQVERVTAGPRPQLGHGQVVYPARDHVLDQCHRGLPIERPDLDPIGEIVLPHLGDG